MSQRWLKKMGATFMVALLVGSVVCAVYAQNAAPTDEPGADIVTPEPTTATPVDTPTETQEPATAVPTEAPPQPTALPTTEAPPQLTDPPVTIDVPVQPVTDVPTDAPVQPVTDVPTEAPIEIVVTIAPTDALPTEATALESTDAAIDATTETPPTVTVTPSDTVEIPSGGDVPTAIATAPTATDPLPATLTAEPTSSDTPTPGQTLTAEVPTETATSAAPLPDPASISLSVDVASVSVGDTVTFTLSGEALEAVEIVSALCEVDPARLTGLSAAAGDVVASASLSDSGFLPSGQWVLRAQSAPDTETSGSGTLWQLSYRVSVEGQALMACRVQLIDAAGNLLPLTSNAVAQAVEVAPAVEAATDVPEATAILPVEPEATVDAPEATSEATVEAPEATIEPTDVLDADAPILTLDPIPGDVDGNGVVNQDDADAVLHYFGQQAPSDTPSVDVNGDGIINIYDLVTVAGSMDKNDHSAGDLFGFKDTPQAK